MTATMKAMIAGVGVLASIIVGYGVTHASGAKDPSPRNGTSSATAGQGAALAAVTSSSANAVPRVESAIADAPCDLEAVPSLPANLDSRVSQLAKTSPFSQALDPKNALDRDAAILQAIQGSSDQSQVMMTAAARVPYSRALRIFGGSANPLVALTRCVWVVTVDGPFDVDSYPAGASPPKLDGATTSIDAASGEPLDSMQGRGSPSLITGANLTN